MGKAKRKGMERREENELNLLEYRTPFGEFGFSKFTTVLMNSYCDNKVKILLGFIQG